MRYSPIDDVTNVLTQYTSVEDLQFDHVDGISLNLIVMAEPPLLHAHASTCLDSRICMQKERCGAMFTLRRALHGGSVPEGSA
ncbi:hypothetical protein DXT87_18330 [Arthrobacter sp. AET 35A]|nr:hypothetical protein [Arthrobacter sp. AET 35A]